MSGLTWLITGVSTGFGRVMTEQLLARGDRVAGTVRQAGALDDLTAAHGERLWLGELDMADFPAIRRVTDAAFAALGRIDVVVSNAGYGLFGAAEELTDEQVENQIAVNLVGSIQLVRAVLPHLRRQGGGRILQLSSMAGQAAFPGASLYNASKWGVEGFIDALAQEVAAFNIGCTLVEPGAARTDFRYRSAQLAPKIADYDATPARVLGRRIELREDPPRGDPLKMVQAMIASVAQTPAPRRLTLGSDAYGAIHRQLSARLAALEAQKGLALSTDA